MLILRVLAHPLPISITKIVPYMSNLLKKSSFSAYKSSKRPIRTTGNSLLWVPHPFTGFQRTYKESNNSTLIGSHEPGSSGMLAPIVRFLSIEIAPVIFFIYQLMSLLLFSRRNYATAVPNGTAATGLQPQDSTYSKCSFCAARTIAVPLGIASSSSLVTALKRITQNA